MRTFPEGIRGLGAFLRFGSWLNMTNLRNAPNRMRGRDKPKEGGSCGGNMVSPEDSRPSVPA